MEHRAVTAVPGAADAADALPLGNGAADSPEGEADVEGHVFVLIPQKKLGTAVHVGENEQYTAGFYSTRAIEAAYFTENGTILV